MRRAVSLERSAKRRRGSSGVALLAGLGLWFAAGSAHAQSTIRQPGQHPRYTVEVEPHLALGLFDPPGLGSGEGIGPGLRLSFPLTDDGFLSKVNDSVALGVGADWVFYEADEGVRVDCARFAPAPNDTRVCVELSDDGADQNYLFVPVVMQWNFWLHRRFSVFGEPGLELHLRRGVGDTDVGAGPVLQMGARWHFADALALSLRLGYPLSSLGLSFLL